MAGEVFMAEVRARLSRRFLRYKVHAPLFFSWSEGGNLEEGEGMTRDFCIGGFFVESSATPSANTIIHFVVQLPRLSKVQLPAFKIEAAGRVTRVEYSKMTSRPFGFAVESETFLLVDADRDLAVQDRRADS
jgi:hypothetical protein